MHTPICNELNYCPCCDTYFCKKYEEEISEELCDTCPINLEIHQELDKIFKEDKI
jgi:hypothetical protein